jgi:hypothetical protein
MAIHPAHRDGRIGEQHTAYRRGLVLGLTMAEVGILVIFVLLLLLALAAFDRQRYAAAVAVSPERLVQLEAAEEALRAINDAVGAMPADTPEEIQELVRAVTETARSPEGQASLRAVRDALEELERTEEEIRRIAERIGGEGGRSMAETVAQQSRDLAIKEGQLRYAEQRLRALSRGADARPCWVQPDGRIVFLYDVILTSDGIRMRLRDDVAASARLADVAARAGFVPASIDPSRTLSEEEFRARTRALYDYGRRAENQCRFHVYVWDGTGPAEKERYKDLLRTVEGHFYKQTTVPNGVPF